MYDVEYIREQMKLLRESKKLTQKAVAEKMGVSPAFYSMMESGKKHISIENVMRFSEATDVPLGELLSKNSKDYDGFEIFTLSDMDKRILSIIKSLSMQEKERIYNALKAANYPEEND